jgi:hypothetical protein
MDEIFTWKEVSDSSLLHLFRAIQNGADGGMPVFYATAWVWARVFWEMRGDAGDAGDAGRCGTSMIGNGQGEAEIPLDLAEGVLPTGKA